MFIKKKATSTHVPAPINVRSGLSFQAHFSTLLTSFLQKRATDGWDLGKTKSGDFDPNLHNRWVTLQYAKTVSVDLQTGEEATGGCSLPLPVHYTQNEEMMKECAQPRVFYNAASFKQPELLVKDIRSRPRDGLQGNFFVREELVDNLYLASQLLQFKSPFWIRPDHKELQSGYLNLNVGAEPITVSFTGLVFLADEVPVPKEVQRFLAVNFTQLPSNHPALLKKSQHSSASTDPAPSSTTALITDPGSNCFTGHLTKNPWFLQACKKGSASQQWYSLDQVRAFWPLDRPESYVQWEKETLAAQKGTLIELDQWDLYNADSLQQPGRLAFNREVSNLTQAAVSELNSYLSSIGKATRPVPTAPAPSTPSATSSSNSDTGSVLNASASNPTPAATARAQPSTTERSNAATDGAQAQTPSLTAECAEAPVAATLTKTTTTTGKAKISTKPTTGAKSKGSGNKKAADTKKHYSL